MDLAFGRTDAYFGYYAAWRRNQESAVRATRYHIDVYSCHFGRYLRNFFAFPISKKWPDLSIRHAMAQRLAQQQSVRALDSLQITNFLRDAFSVRTICWHTKERCNNNLRYNALFDSTDDQFIEKVRSRVWNCLVFWMSNNLSISTYLGKSSATSQRCHSIPSRWDGLIICMAESDTSGNGQYIAEVPLTVGNIASC